MPWSWKLARVAGIDVFVHATFLMVIAWIAVVHGNEHHTPQAVLDGVGFTLALFACVVLYEFGHALAARRYGIRTKDITLPSAVGLVTMDNVGEFLMIQAAERRRPQTS